MVRRALTARAGAPARVPLVFERRCEAFREGSGLPSSAPLDRSDRTGHSARAGALARAATSWPVRAVHPPGPRDGERRRNEQRPGKSPGVERTAPAIEAAQGDERMSKVTSKTWALAAVGGMLAGLAGCG